MVAAEGTDNREEKKVMKNINSALDIALKNLDGTLAKKRKNVAVQLPLWEEGKRGTPNSFLRSSLFAAIQGKDRYLTKNEVLYAQKGITVKYSGERLNQEDLTLWETLVHLSRESPLGDECDFTGYGILKAMRIPTGGNNRKRLREGITRLIACAVEITHGDKQYIGTLIEGAKRDKEENIYYLRLNHELIYLYGDAQYTAIDWEQRLELRRKPLAQALHAFYSTHRDPYPVKLETLHQLIGSRNNGLRGFKQKVKTALNALVTIGFLQSYQIEGDLVSVKRAQNLLITTK